MTTSNRIDLATLANAELAHVTGATMDELTCEHGRSSQAMVDTDGTYDHYFERIAILDRLIAERKAWNTPIVVGTRYGKKAHAGYPGSSVTICGHWLKTDVRQFKISDDLAKVTCEHCLEAPDVTSRVAA